MKGKILVISRNAWNNSNSTGNTATNFFSNWSDWEFANLFCRAEKPDNDICTRYFRLSESDLARNLFKSDEIGKVASYKELTDDAEVSSNINLSKEKKLYDYFRNNRWTLLLWAREVLWLVSNWKNHKLKEFIHDFDPDIIYMPIHDCFYMHNILSFVYKISKAKIVLITADDMYSLKQFSFSPLYWMNRIILRKKIRNSITKSSICYSMSDIQIKELSQEFGNKFKILRKGVELGLDKNQNVSNIKNPSEVITFIYTGNLTLGRWETLAIIGDAINELNKKRIRAKLEIYSTNQLTNKMKHRLNSSNEVRFMGAVDANEVRKIQREADVVVHVESFRLKSKFQTRLSFSTKIVDYFQNSKCIFAAGWEEANSIDYLIRNDAAIVAYNKSMIKEKVKMLLENPSIISEYSHKSWECGLRNHNARTIKGSLINDFSILIKEDI